MPTFREAREVLSYAISENLVSDEEFALLYDINTSKNRDFEYWIYNAFSLHKISDDDYVAEFSFRKDDIPRLVTGLQLPSKIRCGMYIVLRVSSAEALCVILRRLASSCRYTAMMPRFARTVPQLYHPLT